MKILYIYTDAFKNYDILLCLQQTEHSVDVIDTPFLTFEPIDTQIEVFRHTIKHTHYDCVLNFGYVPYLSDVCNELQTPYVSWTYDSILHSLYTDSVENEYNVLFVFDKSEYRYLKEHFSIAHLYHLPLAVNTERINQLVINKTDKAYFSCDISFVGTLYQENTYIDLEPELNSAERQYFEHAFSYFQGQWTGESIFQWFSKEDANYLQQRLPNYLKNDERLPHTRFFGDILLSKPIASRERITLLNTLAKQHPVRLYTKPTENTAVLCNVECFPYVNYYDAMCKAFRFSKINLNLTLHSIVSGIPLRCLDIMGAGGFLLTNYQEELEELFLPDKEYIFYRTLDEAIDKASFYLKHEDLRKKIAQKGNAAIQKSHTYQHRMMQMLNIVTKEFLHA